MEKQFPAHEDEMDLFRQFGHGTDGIAALWTEHKLPEQLIPTVGKEFLVQTRILPLSEAWTQRIRYEGKVSGQPQTVGILVKRKDGTWQRVSHSNKHDVLGDELVAAGVLQIATPPPAEHIWQQTARRQQAILGALEMMMFAQIVMPSQSLEGNHDNDGATGPIVNVYLFRVATDTSS